MGEPKTCKDDEVAKNAEAAKGLGYKFGRAQVLITQRTQLASGQWEIQFVVRGDHRVHTAIWGDTVHMWSPCPSTVPSQAGVGKPGDPPGLGDWGWLYFSASYIKDRQLAARPKWPPSLFASKLPTADLEVFPIGLTLRAYELRSGQLVESTIDLLDAAFAAPDQSLELSEERPLTVSLTPSGFAKFGLPFVGSPALIQTALDVLEGKRDDLERLEAWRVIVEAARSLDDHGLMPNVPEETVGRIRKLLRL